MRTSHGDVFISHILRFMQSSTKRTTVKKHRSSNQTRTIALHCVNLSMYEINYFSQGSQTGNTKRPYFTSGNMDKSPAAIFF